MLLFVNAETASALRFVSMSVTRTSCGWKLCLKESVRLSIALLIMAEVETFERVEREPRDRMDFLSDDEDAPSWTAENFRLLALDVEGVGVGRGGVAVSSLGVVTTTLGSSSSSGPSSSSSPRPSAAKLPLAAEGMRLSTLWSHVQPDVLNGHTSVWLVVCKIVSKGD